MTSRVRVFITTIQIRTYVIILYQEDTYTFCRGADADGVQGGHPGQRGDVADYGDDTKGEGGVLGNRAGGSSVENPKPNPPSPISGDTTT